MKTYLATDELKFSYPAAGDDPPPLGVKVLLLTRGGVCVVGTWQPHGLLGWAPLPKRDREKEKLL